VLGAIVAFLIDRRFLQAGAFALFGSALSFIGLIHGEKVEWNANGQVALGYLFTALLCFGFMALKLPPRDPSEDILPEEGGAPEPPVSEHGVVVLPDGSSTPPVTTATS